MGGQEGSMYRYLDDPIGGQGVGWQERSRYLDDLIGRWSLGGQEKSTVGRQEVSVGQK